MSFLKRKNYKFLFFFVIFLLGVSLVFLSLERKEGVRENYLSELPDQVLVTKVIDGDTIIVEGGYHIRLLGIDADEKGYPCYEEAKKRLEDLILNKKVRLERDKEDKDQYGRYLRFVFLGKENINLEMVKEGLAVARFYAPNFKYRREIKEAEGKAIEQKIGCKWAKEEEGELKVISPLKAGNYLGQKVIIKGKIVDTYRSEKGNVFLNFCHPYPHQCFTVVIFKEDVSNFVKEPEKFYLGKKVAVKGTVTQYKGRLEVIIHRPDEINLEK